MRKKIVSGIILVVILSICVVVVTRIEQMKKPPLERYIDEQEQTSVNVQTDSSSDEVVSSEVPEETTTLENRNVILNDGCTLEYNIISYEVYDDTNILSQKQFLEEYYLDGEYPDPNYLYSGIVYHQLRKDYPEFDEYLDLDYEDHINSTFDYDGFMAEHSDEYTITEHPDTRYVFVTFEVTNISDANVYDSVPLRLCIENDNPVYDAGDGYNDYMCLDSVSYFDYLPDVSGEEFTHHRTWYNFAPGESHTFTVGYTARAYPYQDLPFQFTDQDIYYYCNPYIDEYVTTPADLMRSVCLNDLP
jgi:hypothetical protein